MTTEATGTASDELVAVPVRHWGRWLGAFVVLAVFALVVQAFARADIHYHVVGDYFTASNILKGVWHTLLIRSSTGQQLRIPKGYFP